MNEQYRIKSVEDFLAVPADKRSECLRDFHSWLSITGQKREINKALTEMLGLPDGTEALVTDSFVWVDDGIEGISGITIEGGVE